jgi:23S rRNA pseudouridine2605 synthase
MEEMILAGRITVNRMPADVGQKVSPGDEVRINGELVKVRFAEPRARVLMYHKPAGELVTRDDPEGRPTVFEKLPSIGNGKWINIGRLDYNTEGLLLFTNSGELANRMMHPRFEVEREYAVRIMGRLSEEQMQGLTSGIELEDGPARCDSVEDAGGDDDGANHWYKVVLREGRNREVRRLFEALGTMVSRLIRTRYGTVAMPTVLKRGDLLELEPGEVANVLNAAGLRNGTPAKHGPRNEGQGPRNDGRDQRPGGRKGARPHAGGRPGQGPRQGAPFAGSRGPMQGAGPAGNRPPGRGGKGFTKGPRPNGPNTQPNGPRHDYDERQPLSNANASPFATSTLSVRGGMPRGHQGAPRPYGQNDNARGQGPGHHRSGKGSRPQGPGSGAPRPQGQPRPPGQAPRVHGQGGARPQGAGGPPGKRHRGRNPNRPRNPQAAQPEAAPREEAPRVDDES